MRDLFVIIGSLLIAVVAAAFAVPRFIDWAPYKDEIEQRVAAAIGLDLKLVGPVRIELLPRLLLHAEDVTLDTEDVALSAAHLTLELSPVSLIGGKPRIVSAEIEDGVVKLSASIANDPAAALIGRMQAGERAPVIDRLSLTNVAVMRAGGGAPIATVRTGEMDLPASEGPLRLTAEGELGGAPGRARLAVGAPEADGHRHVALALDADNGAQPRSWRLTFEGDTAKDKASPVAFDGAFLLTQGAAAPSLPGNDNKDVGLWRVQAKAHAEARRISFDEVEISRERAAALRLNGKAVLDLAGTPRLELNLSARRLVLDPVIATSPSPKDGAPRIDTALAAFASNVTAAVPNGLGVAFDIGAESVELAGESFERLRAKGEASTGTLTLSSLESNWVGRGEVRFSGGGAPARGEMRGHVEVKATDAAAFLRGLGLAGETANARIPLALASELALTTQSLRLDAIDLSLSASKISGSLVLTRENGGDGPRIDANLMSRDLDLDAWPLGAVTSVIPASLPGRLQVHVERLRAGHGAGDVGRLDMALSRKGTETSIDELKLQGYDGLALTGSGSIGGTGSSFEAHIASPKSAPLLALARLVVPQAMVEALGARSAAIEPLALALTAKRDAASPNIEVSLSGTAAASRLDAKGSLDTLLAPIAGDVVLSAPEARILLVQLGLATGQGEPLGRGEVKLAMKPGGAGQMAVTASLVAGDTKVSGDGTLAWGDAPEGHGGFSASIPNLGLAARLLGYTARLDGDPHADISGGWTLSPETLALERLNLHLLGKALTGALSLALAEPRRLTGEIRAPLISFPALAALALGSIRTQSAPGASAAPAQTASFWSSTRLPAYAPPPVPVSLDITAPIADLGGTIAGRDAKLTLELGERGIAMTAMSAAFSGGRLGGDWRIERDGGLGRSVLRLTADGIQLKELMPAAHLAGTLSGGLELAGSGETPAQIVASSGGGGTLGISEGFVEQADIAALRRSFAKAVADDNPMDKQRLSALVAGETARGPLAGLHFEAPLIATAGAVKATMPRQALSASDEGAEGTLALDLKTLTLDARLGLSAISPGLPENRVPLAAAILWKGPLFAPKRDVDVAPLLQAVSIERLRLELERVELLEFDQREQAMFNRRLRAFRQKALPLPPTPEQPAAPAQALPPADPPPKTNAVKPESGSSSPPVEPGPRPAPGLAPLPSPIAYVPAHGVAYPDPRPFRRPDGADERGKAP